MQSPVFVRMLSPSIPSMIIVEDQNLVRLGLQLMFEERKTALVLDSVIDGRSAIREVQKLCPDMVFMDINLPDMSGLEATRQIKTLVPDTRVIIFTSHQDSRLIAAAIEAGADGYCFKDTAINLIDEGIASVMQGLLWLAPPIADILIRMSKTDSGSTLKLSITETTILGLLRQNFGVEQISAKLDADQQTIVKILKTLIGRSATYSEG